jgi:hypothetical protein
MSDKGRGTPCLICDTPPQAGWGFCHRCYTRLRHRVYKMMREKGIDDPTERKDFMTEWMCRYGNEAKLGRTTAISAHASNIIHSCMKCQKPGKKVVSRGLCNTCFVFYKRKVKKGVTSWQELEQKRLCYPPRTRGRIK